MGMRSKVAIAMPEKDYQVLLKNIKSLKTAKFKLGTELAYLIDNVDENTTSRFANYFTKETIPCRILYWQSIKWYEDEPYIKYIMDFVNSLSMYEYAIVAEDILDDYMDCVYRVEGDIAGVVYPVPAITINGVLH